MSDAQQPLWSDERVKERANELDGELFDGNTRPWQHYMIVWRTLSYEMRDEYEAELQRLRSENEQLRQQIDVEGMLAFTNQVHREHIALLQDKLADSQPAAQQTRAYPLLASFTQFCHEHPQLRFWQALSNWVGWHSVLVAQHGGYDAEANLIREHVTDTYYWEENKEPPQESSGA